MIETLNPPCLKCQNEPKLHGRVNKSDKKEAKGQMTKNGKVVKNVQRPENDKTWQNDLKWQKLTQNGPKWPKMAQK